MSRRPPSPRATLFPGSIYRWQHGFAPKTTRTKQPRLFLHRLRRRRYRFLCISNMCVHLKQKIMAITARMAYCPFTPRGEGHSDASASNKAYCDDFKRTVCRHGAINYCREPIFSNPTPVNCGCFRNFMKKEEPIGLVLARHHIHHFCSCCFSGHSARTAKTQNNHH